MQAMQIIIVWRVLPILLVILMWYYLYRIILRGVRYFRKDTIEKRPKKINRIFAIICSVFILISARNIFSSWAMAVLHFGGISLFIDIIYGIARKIIKKEMPVWVKRIYYSSGAALLLTVVVIGYGYWNMRNIVETDYTVQTSKSMRAEGYKIALIADLHFGTTMDVDKLYQEAAKVQQAEPDIVVLDGDIVDERTSLEEMQQAFAALGSIESTYGTYYVYGNHDMSLYTQKPNYTRTQLDMAIQEAGITILEDKTAVINDELVLIGRADRSYASTTRASIQELVQEVDVSQTWIVLDHQPCEYEEVKNTGCDIVLSGHTHGGQIWPGGLLATTFNFDDLDYGYEKLENLNEIVTSGMAGWGYPLRTQRHSEFVMIQVQ